MSSFVDEDHAKSVATICGEHAHVIPTEHYMQVESDARLREVAWLQQRAHALATEIERRRELELSLRKALERAESASRAKSDFLAMMSHELRTPLNAIGGHVQLVEMELHGPINDRQRDALSRVQRSQRHLLALINDVLNLVRAESAAVEFQTEPIALLPFLSDVTELLGPLFTSADIGLEVRAAQSADPPSVSADREKVHQIVLNLLGNALKFTPAGGSVSIEVGPADDARSLIRIDVRDTGVGIPADKLEQIFQPFVQLGASASEQRRGIGLGLSISRALARGMGGDLSASRGPECGSILSLTLPRA